MNVPSQPWTLMKRVYKDVLPYVHEELNYWRERAEHIPNEELRTQALASISSKTFHCEGGGIYSLLSNGPTRQKDVIKFIVAYQTISDYLDNLCDRSTSLDPLDFEQLHRSMPHALKPEASLENYYLHREEQDDGGYLHDLVQTCQTVLVNLPGFPHIEDTLKELADHYCNLQVHKHVKKDERVPRLKDWFDQNKNTLPPMSWYEFSACAGSTIGIFCLISYATHDGFQPDWANKVKNGYFPWIQGLHIMMDYLIDQEEDRAGGDLNFCFYYDDENEMVTRLLHFFQMADKSTKELPHARFHSLVTRGLLGIYASDEKVRAQKDVRTVTKRLMRAGGMTAYYYYWNSMMYRKIKA
ncbi:tetraprenyl-beta-curcumene synthase family protein [Pseudalkalibacillus decolorationis]|uniref:tetraprenyl-beta-curcumene synthase family protein n=1 Tax=Pseudalkalibacillus decolorationis TaxID=163879 RepID=UPI0021489687|nr:tetraprenyl-beta-curcumene synthase family protein [Pseudalkalibacillus decolorationis]